MKNRNWIAALLLLALCLVFAWTVRQTHPASLQTISFRLPLRIWAEAESNDRVTFTAISLTGRQEVGGITAYSADGTAPEALTKLWNGRDIAAVSDLLSALGILPAEDSGLGYMLSNDTRGDWEADIFLDTADTLSRWEHRHIFFLDGTIIYDLWLDRAYYR